MAATVSGESTSPSRVMASNWFSTATERAAIDELDRHRIPHNYKTPSLTPSMYDAMYALATDPAARHAFERDPDAFLCANPNLRADERDALRSARMRPIHGSMRDGPDPAQIA